MNPISVVIITKNEAKNIGDCIRSALTVSDDVIVVDCGSEDQSVALAEGCGARVLLIDWQCYGHSRNAGADVAKHDWILSLDADERISSTLADRLCCIPLNDSFVYKIKRRNYFGDKLLKYGTLGFESVARLYNRKKLQWDLVPVHERLQGQGVKKKISDPIEHFGITNLAELSEKKEHYAYLSAQKYLQQNKKAGILKRFLSPLFNGAKSYVFQAGFLDGRKGWQIARVITYYTWLKYKRLHQIDKQRKNTEGGLQPTVGVFNGAIHSFFARR